MAELYIKSSNSYSCNNPIYKISKYPLPTHKGMCTIPTADQNWHIQNLQITQYEQKYNQDVNVTSELIRPTVF